MNTQTSHTKRGRRPRPFSMPRTSVRTRLTVTERAAIESKAARAGLTLSGFIRRAALGRQVRASVPAINMAAWSDLSRLAGNLHQFLQLAHAGRVGDLYSVKSEIQALRKAVDGLRLDLVDTGNGAEVEE